MGTVSRRLGLIDQRNGLGSRFAKWLCPLLGAAGAAIYSREPIQTSSTARSNAVRIGAGKGKDSITSDRYARALAATEDG